MKAWQRLAWTEWHRSIVKGKPNRDFLWLTMLLFLTLILALLLWGGREGLLNKFVDVSVGYIEEAGIPIWLTASNMRGIDRVVMERTQQDNIKLYPYREVEWIDVDLPISTAENPANADEGPKIWDATVLPFGGWAVSVDDPLWQMGLKTDAAMVSGNKSSLPLDVILNRSLFEQYFLCDVYVSALKHLPLTAKTPEQAFSPFTIPKPSASDKLACLANGFLWLQVHVGKHKELLPFRIHWQAHIPTMDKLAFLFPLSTLNTLKLAKHHDDLIYYPETQVDKTTRVKQLTLMGWWGEEAFASDKNMTTFLSCLQHTKKESNLLLLEPPLPKAWVMQCAKKSEITLQIGREKLSFPFVKITDEPKGDDFQYQADDYLTILCPNKAACQPCETLVPLSLKQWLGKKGLKCSDTAATIDMMAANGPYQRAFAYVENRTALSTQVEKIKAFQLPQQDSKAFYIHPTYDDALVRFRFIDAIMVILKWFYSPFFLGFLIILLLVQIGIVITHRKHNYGIFLAKGLAVRQVRGMVLMQIGISVGVAMGLSVLIGEIMQWLLALQLESVTMSKPYIDHIIASHLDLLPLSWLDYMEVGFVAVFMLVVITVGLLKYMVSNRQMEPAYLF
jgi:hypothetical protein